MQSKTTKAIHDEIAILNSEHADLIKLKPSTLAERMNQSNRNSELFKQLQKLTSQLESGERADASMPSRLRKALR
ncbi:hypothetical protein [Vibrio bathopelagicus]